MKNLAFLLLDAAMWNGPQSKVGPAALQTAAALTFLLALFGVLLLAMLLTLSSPQSQEAVKKPVSGLTPDMANKTAPGAEERKQDGAAQFREIHAILSNLSKLPSGDNVPKEKLAEPHIDTAQEANEPASYTGSTKAPDLNAALTVAGDATVLTGLCLTATPVADGVAATATVLDATAGVTAEVVTSTVDAGCSAGCLVALLLPLMLPILLL